MHTDEDFDELIEDFLVESGEMIESLDQDLVALESRPDDLDLLNRAFRYIHTVKGTSDFLHFSALTGLSHAMEDVLDPLRAGKLSLTPKIMDLILEGVDGIKAFLADIEARREHSLDVSSLAETLRGIGRSAGQSLPAEEKEPSPPPEPKPPERPSGLSEDEYREIFGDFVEESRERLQESRADFQALRADPGDMEKIERLFRSMHTIKGTASFLGIDALRELAGAMERFLEGHKEEGKALIPFELELVEEGLEGVGERLGQAASGASPKPAAQIAAKLRALSPPEEEPGGEIAAAQARGGEGESAAAQARGGEGERGRGGEGPRSEATIRVDTSRLDELMNLIGELVLGRNRLIQAVREAESPSDVETSLASLADISDFIDVITSDLQKTVIKTRMLPVGRIFNKFPRIVRDLAREKGKQVTLDIRGADTELDKSVIDEISDPLVHLIRNAVDHGIEAPPERERAGKEAAGRILLSARQEGNRIAIEVSDDGRGLDLERIRRKAVEKGLVSEEEAQALPDGEAAYMIFNPGFSTAEKVDRTSGRGVGMDVVKNNIEKLGGFVELDSTPGAGMRFVVKLPLTLAIIPVLMVRVFDEVFALPAVSVIETVRLHPGELKTIDGKEVINLRGKILPLLRISDLFGLDGDAGEDNSRQYVVVAGLAERRIGLLIQGLIGQEEVVIKPLGDLFDSTEGIAGATIRGDGRVALILDISSLAKISPSPRLSSRPPAAPKPRAAAPSAPAADAQKPRHGRFNVLVVDDSAVERKIVRKAVEALGHRVFDASDGASALAKLGDMDFDIIITDIEMEGMDGLELAHRVRSQTKWRHLPVVALSTHGQMVDRIRGSEAGLDAYLVKPLDREELERTLRRLCQG